MPVTNEGVYIRIPYTKKYGNPHPGGHDCILSGGVVSPDNSPTNQTFGASFGSSVFSYLKKAEQLYQLPSFQLT